MGRSAEKSMTNKDAMEKNKTERNLMNKLCSFHNQLVFHYV